MTDKKNPLAIRLTESAVFLRTDNSRRSRGQEARPSMLRGLLVLELLKPTRITSIELELLAKTRIAWPEGIGARRTEIIEEHTLFHAETVYFRAGKVPMRRNASIGPGIAYGYTEAGFESDEHEMLSHTPRNHREVSPLATDDTGSQRNIPRRLSADSSNFQRAPLSHEEFPVTPTPPYTPFSSPSSPTRDFTAEDLRHPSNIVLQNFRSPSVELTPTSSNFRSSHPEFCSSRRMGVDSGPEDETGLRTPRTMSSSRTDSRSGSRTISRPSSRPPTPPGTFTHHGIAERRGRPGSRSRFTLASVSNVLMDVVRSSSPMTGHFSSNSSSHDRVGDDEKLRRGRPKEKSGSKPNPTAPTVGVSKERSTFSKIGDILKLDHDHNGAESGWKEFKKGTYTYPISFSIPANAPPTLNCNYGSVIWRLRATVHRPGAFKVKYAAHREVIMVSCPTEEDTEDTENIIVERHWEQQLQYLISISGRSFYIGGTIPITITLMPLAKVKIHRILVFIEERIDYYTHMKRVARTDPLRHIDLLTVKEPGKNAGFILPLVSDDADAFKNSPLYALISPDADPSEVASSLMGPGPWTFHQDLHLPTTCGLMHITNKNRRSNLVVTHQLKCVMRVERGDDLHVDPKTGKRKQFDIVIQTPVHILSCRCDPEWTSLPRYSESFDGTATVLPKCPCDTRRAEELRLRALTRPSALERMSSSRSSDSSVSVAETSPVNPGMPSLCQQDSLYSRSTLYERLISGQESEIGEAPPTYTACFGLFSQQSH